MLADEVDGGGVGVVCACLAFDHGESLLAGFLALFLFLEEELEGRLGDGSTGIIAWLARLSAVALLPGWPLGGGQGGSRTALAQSLHHPLFGLGPAGTDDLGGNGREAGAEGALAELGGDFGGLDGGLLAEGPGAVLRVDLGVEGTVRDGLAGALLEGLLRALVAQDRVLVEAFVGLATDIGGALA